jgi:hypothetical protein
MIGEPEGGWFCLPPWSLWEAWAKEGLENAERRIAEVKSHSGPTVHRADLSDC